jgi:hypothetical protein
MTKFILIIFLSIIAGRAFSLVDYSEVSESSDLLPAPTLNKPGKLNGVSSTASSGAKKNAASTSSFALSTGFSQNSIQIENEKYDVGSLNIHGHFDTNYSLFLDINHSLHSSENSALTTNSSYQQGNPIVILGFNWWRQGGAENLATFDIYGGAKVAQKHDLSSTQTSKIIGVETSKRFSVLALTLNYEIRLNATPSSLEEMSSGNMQKLGAALGWVVSQDIRFAFEANHYNLSPSNETNRINKLQDKLSFGTLTPKLLLGIANTFEIELGAIFRTKKIPNQKEYLALRLWDVPGAYGNALFAGLNLGI